MTGPHDATPEVRLRAVEDHDLEVFFDHQADPQAVAMAAFPARDKEQFEAHWAKIRIDDTLVVRTIVADGMVAGNNGSWPADGQQTLGYWVGRDYWGRGLATEAAQAVVAHTRAELGLRRLVSVHIVGNEASARVMVKLGMALERETVQPGTGRRVRVYAMDLH